MSNDLIKCVDFCGKCKQLFKDDVTYTCSTPDCSGLRFAGSMNNQHLKKKQHFFATIPLSNQLVEITDRLQVKPASLTFNTDGVPLYNSSSLWPVVIVINDLPPSQRFATQNVLLWGLWQGIGKPVFRPYLKPMVDELNVIYKQGLDCSIGRIYPKLTVGTMDLQAKAYVMEMTQHNGSHGCLTCEEPGQSCQQGKGTSKGYPFREETPTLRTTESILDNASFALNSKEKYVKGIRSESVLFDIKYFDPSESLVPDYMHGVLLGTTKQLLCLWFDKGSKEPYNISKVVKDVDARLSCIRPTDDIPRLPRKLEGTKQHWKASELQNWLLFYGIPCLDGILPRPYFDNFCHLVTTDIYASWGHYFRF
ncbi:LOW QUALITY PROTEIN: hypothetical protein MAR_018742 [Mya arenaria]|uniref:Uncharacterized protein n=1 Tax=Mya arenaria TaxID=6604 RepID=A0ABY7EIC4_MYAAR|nr:LOW QUALITY PROTEIN: hypothetical protein MAR_018742 [Mya arenaria]